MKKITLLLFITLLTAVNSRSSHYLCNDIRMEQIGPNQFRIILRIAGSQTLNPASSIGISVIEQNVNTLFTTKSLSLDSSRVISTTISGTTYGFTIAYYSDTIQLPNSINGYYTSSNHCCRAQVTNHSINGGVVFTCDAPNPMITGGNSNPKFIDYPDSLFLVVGLNRILDFSSTDTDGDSLVYSLINPFDMTGSGGAKPFNLLSYGTGYSLLNILGPGSTCNINSSTGIVNARSTQIGQYVIAVKCEEYRNGVKIGQVIRDITIPSINASFPTSIDEKLAYFNLSIYPNPTNGNFTVSMEDYKGDNYTMQVTDVSGKLVYSESINFSKSIISLNELNKGIYFVKVSDGINQVVKKIVIQ